MHLSEEEQALLDSMDFDELLRELEERLREQTGQHDGGSHWIGRGGTSPFGHSGYHHAGIRIVVNPAAGMPYKLPSRGGSGTIAAI